MAGSTTSHGIPARVACSSRPRIVWLLPAPVAPVTNTCRFSEASGRASVPAGTLFWSSTIPAETPVPSVPSVVRVVSGVTSNVGRSVNRSPGTSRAGGCASAATSLAEAKNGDCGLRVSRSSWACRNASAGDGSLPGRGHCRLLSGGAGPLHGPADIGASHHDRSAAGVATGGRVWRGIGRLPLPTAAVKVSGSDPVTGRGVSP